MRRGGMIRTKRASGMSVDAVSVGNQRDDGDQPSVQRRKSPRVAGQPPGPGLFGVQGELCEPHLTIVLCVGTYVVSWRHPVTP